MFLFQDRTDGSKCGAVCDVQMLKQTTKKGPKDSWRPGGLFCWKHVYFG